MNDSRDPLIFGPSNAGQPKPENRETGAASDAEGSRQASQQNTTPTLDLNTSNPLEDFSWLFLKPKQFFRFFSSSIEFNSWLAAKSFVGLIILIFLRDIVERGNWVETLQSALHQLSLNMPLEQKLYFEQRGLGVDSLTKLLSAGALSFWQFRFLLGPATVITHLLFLVASTLLFLPLVGVSKKDIRFSKLFWMNCYANWYTILGVFSGIGSFLSALLIPLMTIRGVQNMFGLSFIRAFFAVYGFFIITTLLGALALISSLVILASALS